MELGFKLRHALCIRCRRDVPVVDPNFFTRDPATKRLKVAPRKKLYGLVFDKRVVDRETFRSYPYGYA